MRCLEQANDLLRDDNCCCCLIYLAGIGEYNIIFVSSANDELYIVTVCAVVIENKMQQLITHRPTAYYVCNIYTFEFLNHIVMRIINWAIFYFLVKISFACK